MDRTLSCSLRDHPRSVRPDLGDRAGGVGRPDRALYARQRRMTDLAKVVWMVLGIIVVLVYLASQTSMGSG
jgi:hypothetical protein